METLGQRARARRRELGLTQKRVAAACNITQQAYEKLKTGKVSRPRYLPELAELLQTSSKWLLTGTDGEPGLEKKTGKIPVYLYPGSGNKAPRIDWENDTPIDFIAPLPGMENAAGAAVLYIQGDGLEPVYRHSYSVLSTAANNRPRAWIAYTMMQRERTSAAMPAMTMRAILLSPTVSRGRSKFLPRR
jgi:transcriptional regulator with XRE-family HTH domain